MVSKHSKSQLLILFLIRPKLILNVSEKASFGPLIFNEVLTSSDNINDFILTRLTKLKRRALKNLVNTLPDRNILEIKEDEILYYVNNGFLVIIPNIKCSQLKRE